MVTLRRHVTAGQVTRRSSGVHVHWFRWVGDDPFGQAGVYACRCGIARAGL